MLVFWFGQEIVFGVTYILSVQYSCAVVSVILLWRKSFITTGKKSSSRLSGELCCCVDFWFWREIGFGFTYYYVLGVPYICGVVFFFAEKIKIQSSVWRVRDHYYDRKNSSSRLSGGCAIVITTGKKSSSCLSGGCAIVITTGKKKF